MLYTGGMKLALYDELTSWYRLLDDPSEHEDEMLDYTAALSEACSGPCETLLEIGAGAGNNALFLKRRFDCTLSDLSDPMLDLSRTMNPTCEHVAGDMRTLRLDRTFDAVLIHDAIVYMTDLSQLRAAIDTAYLHTRPGGAAIFAPDCIRDSFHEFTETHEASEGDRALRCLSWAWSPDTEGSIYYSDYAFLLREGDAVRAVHDRHVEGLFSDAEWQAVLTSAGYEVQRRARELDDDSGYAPHIYVCKRPSSA